MEYNRLTEEDKKDGYIWLKGKQLHLDEEYTLIKQRLWDLENKIEQGEFIELPCKVGDTVYIACKWDINEVVKGTVFDLEFSFNPRRNSFMTRIYVNHDFIYSKTNENKVENRYIFSKNEVFLIREEAEQRLKEIQNG